MAFGARMSSNEAEANERRSSEGPDYQSELLADLVGMAFYPENPPAPGEREPARGGEGAGSGPPGHEAGPVAVGESPETSRSRGTAGYLSERVSPLASPQREGTDRKDEARGAKLSSMETIGAVVPTESDQASKDSLEQQFKAAVARSPSRRPVVESRRATSVVRSNSSMNLESVLQLSSGRMAMVESSGPQATSLSASGIEPHLESHTDLDDSGRDIRADLNTLGGTGISTRRDLLSPEASPRLNRRDDEVFSPKPDNQPNAEPSEISSQGADAFDHDDLDSLAGIAAGSERELINSSNYASNYSSKRESLSSIQEDINKRNSKMAYKSRAHDMLEDAAVQDATEGQANLAL